MCVGDIQPRGERGIEARQKVSIPVQGHLYRGVTKTFHDRLGVRSLRDEQRGTCMSKVVEAEPLRETSGAESRLEMPLIEETMPQRTSLWRGEHEVVRTVSPVSEVF